MSLAPWSRFRVTLSSPPTAAATKTSAPIVGASLVPVIVTVAVCATELPSPSLMV